MLIISYLQSTVIVVILEESKRKIYSTVQIVVIVAEYPQEGPASLSFKGLWICKLLQSVGIGERVVTFY